MGAPRVVEVVPDVVSTSSSQSTVEAKPPAAVKSADKPIEAKPVAAHGRVLVRDLLEQHSAAIAQLKAAVCDDPLFSAERHDELWLVRFLLSHKGNVAASASAVKNCMAYRHKHNLDDPALPVSGPAALKVPEIAKLYGHMTDVSAMMFYQPDADRGAFLMVTPTMIDAHAIVANVTQAEHFVEQRYATEWLFRSCDETTRCTGYLTKSIRLVNLEGITFGKVNREFQGRLATMAKEMEDVYPQLIGAVLICNPPSFVSFVFRAMRPLLPKRIIEKVDFVVPKTVAADRERVLKHVAVEHWPAHLGGALTAWPPQNARFAP